ncbi:MAG: hypothetical protein RLZ44_411, partial [Pseudomonadota bacterium]
ATPDSGYTDSDLTLPLEEMDTTEIAPLQRLPEFEDEVLAASDRDDDAAVLKLELARAYMEIGDNEGAREILTQLVEDSLSGSEQQEARRLLARLG